MKDVDHEKCGINGNNGQEIKETVMMITIIDKISNWTQKSLIIHWKIKPWSNRFSIDNNTKLFSICQSLLPKTIKDRSRTGTYVHLLMAMFRSLLKTNPASLWDSLSTITGNPLKSVSSRSCSLGKTNKQANKWIISFFFVKFMNSFFCKIAKNNYCKITALALLQN